MGPTQACRHTSGPWWGDGGGRMPQRSTHPRWRQPTPHYLLPTSCPTHQSSRRLPSSIQRRSSGSRRGQWQSTNGNKQWRGPHDNREKPYPPPPALSAYTQTAATAKGQRSTGLDPGPQDSTTREGG
ncbi:Hypothetical predicted protein [Pelobates cultripes]|uniref:Uncharacterized protein n=1 Tax=Pelobates cultripes TaxID=61616 RepID=A0AAD1S8L6_PELCU|nr:Hypothetical predicted protein [Pelobates cultripes]